MIEQGESALVAATDPTTPLSAERLPRGAQALRTEAIALDIDRLDLTRMGVMQHFAKAGRSAQLLTFLLGLDGRDSWAVDFGEYSSPQAFDIQLYMADLAKVVDTSAGVLHRVPREFAEVLSHITTSRCMYVIRYVAQRNPEFVDALVELLQAESAANPNLAAIRQRFESFSKAKLLGEIFSGQRLARIVSIMRSEPNV